MTVSSDDRFVQTFSVWKIAVFECLAVPSAIWPLTPGFSQGRHYTVGPPLMVALIPCVGFLLLCIIALPALWRAIRGLPAIEVARDMVTVHGLSKRSVATSRIVKIGSLKRGIVTIDIAGERPLTLPLFFYRDPVATLTKLRALLPAR